MKTLSIIILIVALAYFLTLQYAQGLIMGHPLEFWDSADIILDGVVISTHLNETDKLVQHDVRVEQYFKNPKPQKMITVYGPDAYNEDWFYPKFFNEGERALLYLKKIDDKYIILEQSRAATEECNPRDMIGLSTLPGEPVGRGGPTIFFDPYQTCNGYLYSVDYLSRTLKPLKQFEAGIKLEDIRCVEDRVMIVKIDGTPACVKPESVSKLVDRGWAVSAPEKFEPSDTISEPETSPLQIKVVGENQVRRGTTHSIEIQVVRGNMPIEGARVFIDIEDYGEDIIKEFDGYTNSEGFFVFSWEIPQSFDDVETLLAFIDVTDGISSKTELFKFQVYCLPGEKNCKVEGN